MATLSMLQNGWSAGRGSVSKTSRMAPPSFLSRSAREQRRLVHDRAARDVDQPRPGFHRGELHGADQPSRRGEERHRHHREVRGGEGGADGAGPIDSRGAGHGSAAPADPDHAHPRRAREPGDGAADVAEADHAECGPGQPIRIHRAPAPLALVFSEAIDALGDPETPAERVLGHPRAEDARRARDRDAPGQLGNEHLVHSRAHHLHPSERGGPSEERHGKVPRVEDLGAPDERLGLSARGGDVDGEGAAREADQIGIRARVRRRRAVHEDVAGGRRTGRRPRRRRAHAPIFERIWSSKLVSTDRRSSPAAPYHSHVCLSPEASV